MYEAVQNVEFADRRGQSPEETILGVFETEDQAVEVARRARDTFEEEYPKDVGWWIVRRQGEHLATWIADSRSTKEYVLDLRSGELIELNP